MNTRHRVAGVIVAMGLALLPAHADDLHSGGPRAEAPRAEAPPAGGPHAGGPRAGGPHAGRPGTRRAETGFAELVRLFTVACVRAFPDASAVGTVAQESHYLAMTPEEVRTYLHRDPGQGWFLHTPLGGYAITVEDPPVRACAVRRMTPAGIANAEAFAKLISDDATRRHLEVMKMQAQSTRTRDGADVIALPYALLAPGAKAASEFYMLLLTNYHGQYRQRFSEDAAGGDGIEIRLVRQIPPSALQRS